MARGKSLPPRSVTPTRKPVDGGDSGSNASLRFRFQLLEDGDYPLHKIQRDEHKRLLKALSKLEEMTVSQAKQTKRLAVLNSLSSCPNKAAAEQIKRKLNNLSETMDVSFAELRIEQSQDARFVGFLEYKGGQAEFYLFWWDPKHQIWPERKTRR